LFSHWIDPFADFEGKSRSEEETFRLEHEHFIVVDSLKAIGKGIDDESVYLWVADDREDVDEGHRFPIFVLFEIVVGLGGPLNELNIPLLHGYDNILC